MSSYCEYCGSKLEDGQICNCPDSIQARGGAQQYPPVYETQPQYVAPPQAKPPYDPHQTPPQYTPGFKQQIPPQYPPPNPTPYGAPPYGAPVPQAPGAVSQTFGAIKDTLGNFAKDPYGAATRASSLNQSVSGSLLAVQVLAFTLMVAVALSRFFDRVLGGNSFAKDMKKEIMKGIGFTEYLKIALIGAIGIGVLFLCIFLASKIAKIPIDPKTMFSSMGMSSIMMSSAFVVTVAVLLLFGFSYMGLALCYLAVSMGGIGSLLLLEISIRGVMPPNTGDVKRLVCLTVSYAMGHVLTFFMIYKIYEDALSEITRQIMRAF